MTPAQRLLYLRIGDARALAPARRLADAEVADLRWVLARMLVADRLTHRGRASMVGLREWQQQIEATPWWSGIYLLWQAGGFRRRASVYQLDDGRFLSLAGDWSGWLACPAHACAVRAVIVPPQPVRTRWKM